MKKICVFIIGMLWASFVFGENVAIHGFISQGYMNSTDNNFLADTKDGTFQFNEMGISFSTSVTDQLHLGTQFFARDLGTEGNDEVVLDWAYANYSVNEKLGVCVGMMRMIFNLYNDSRDSDASHVVALLPQSVYQELYRDAVTRIKGIGIYGHFTAPFHGLFSYDFQVGVLDMNQESGFASAFVDNIKKGFLFNISVDSLTHDTATSGRLMWQLPVNPCPFINMLNFGAGFWDFQGVRFEGQMELLGMPYTYENDTLRTWFYFVDYIYKNIHITYEYAKVDIEGVFRAGDFSSKKPAPSEGWYVLGAYRFSDFVEAAVGYQEYYPHSKDKKGGFLASAGYPPFLNWLYDTSATLRFDINEHWIAKLEYHYMDGFGVFNSAENDENDLKRYWHLFVMKATFCF